MRRTGLQFGLRITSFPLDESRGVSFLNQITRYLDTFKDGFHSAWIEDHLFPWLETIPREADTLECFTAISYLSALYPNLNFGSLVFCNSYRNPCLLAKMAATLQALTGGRLILGMGAGWNEPEYNSYGYPFPTARVRIEQLEEAVRIVKEMLIRGVSTMKGRYYEVEDAHCHPRPKPPPIMIGGGGEKLMLKVVARHADLWNTPLIAPENFKRKLEILNKYCEEAGRDPAEIKKTLPINFSTAPTEGEAEEIMIRNPLYDPQNREGFIVGTPEMVRDRILEYADLGVELFILRFLDFPRPDCATLFLKEVAPKL